MMQKCSKCGTEFSDIEIHILMNDGTLRCAPCGSIPTWTQSEWQELVSRLDGTIDALRKVARRMERDFR